MPRLRQWRTRTLGAVMAQAPATGYPTATVATAIVGRRHSLGRRRTLSLDDISAHIGLDPRLVTHACSSGIVGTARDSARGTASAGCPGQSARDPTMPKSSTRLSVSGSYWTP